MRSPSSSSPDIVMVPPVYIFAAIVPAVMVAGLYFFDHSVASQLAQQKGVILWLTWNSSFKWGSSTIPMHTKSLVVLKKQIICKKMVKSAMVYIKLNASNLEIYGRIEEVFIEMDEGIGEKIVLTQLRYRLNIPIPYVFMLRFLKASQSDQKLEHLAFYLIELCLLEYEALHFKPSLLCASAIYVARCNLNVIPAWTTLLSKHA